MFLAFVVRCSVLNLLLGRFVRQVRALCPREEQGRHPEGAGCSHIALATRQEKSGKRHNCPSQACLDLYSILSLLLVHNIKMLFE